MSEHSPSNPEVLELDAVTGSVRLPASWVEIVETRREGDDLLVQLADGRLLLVPGFFSIEQAVALVREPTGVILALDITPDGESQGVRSVSLSWLEEMFGIDPEELADAEDEAAEEPEEEPAEEASDDQDAEAAAAPVIEEEAEADSAAAAEPEADQTAARPPREPKSAGSYVDEAMVVAAVLGVTALVGADDESDPPLSVEPALEPVLPNIEVVERGITEAEQERIFDAANLAIPDAASIPGSEDVVWTPVGAGGRSAMQASFDLDQDSTVDAQATIHFNADYAATGIDFDDNNDGTTDRSVTYTVNEDGQHTFARYDDDGDGAYDRAVAYGTNSEGSRVNRYDDDYSGAFQSDRTETVTMEAGGTTVVEVDENRDGSPERIERRYLDESGKLSDVWIFDLSDGNPDDLNALRTYHYNDIGILERVDYDEFADQRVERSEFYLRGEGAASRAETYSRDSQGQLVAISYDDDNDGFTDWTAVLVYEAAAGGSAISGRTVDPDPQRQATDHRAVSLTVDEDFDRFSDRAEHYEYASSGYARGRLTAITYDSDHSNDGTFELRETFEYDPSNPLQDQPLRKYIDRFADGTVERAEQYSYSQTHDGQIERIEYDDSYDGTSFQADRAEDMEYNSRGAVSRTRFDDDNDGDTDRIAEYSYGLDARIAEARLDRNADGTWDSIEQHSWNSSGKRAGRVYDSNADGTPDRIETYQYNIKGRISEIRLDSDADGTVDSAASITYDRRGQETARRHDYDADGTANRIDTYSYDGKGRLVGLTIEADHNDNGYSVYERVDTLQYSDGLLTSRRTVYDSDEDGRSELDDTILYNANGIRYERTTRYDDDEDGTFNREEHHVWNIGDDTSPLAARLYPNANLVSTFLYDRPTDGTNDGTPNQKEVRQYDSQGMIDTGAQYFDNDNDGTWDRLVRTTYDNGRQHILEIFEDFDGTMSADRIAVYEHDVQGNLVRVKYDEDADGQGRVDFERIETYTGRNSQGYLTHISHDDDADGNVDRTEVREYHAGNWHERSTFVYDEGNAGSERRETLTYDQYGRLILTEYDGGLGPDNSLGREDPGGDDYGTADGTKDWEEEIAWSGGAIESITLRYFGASASGSALPEKTEVHYYEQGEVVRVVHDGQTVLDGTADSLGEVDPDGTAYGTADGTADWTETFEYGPEPGIALRTTASYNAKGDTTPKAAVIQEDHTDGRLIRIHRWDDADATADGTMDRAEEHHFTADGHLIHILNDDDNDGIIESKEEFVFNAQNIAFRDILTEYAADGESVVRTTVSEFDANQSPKLLTEEVVTEYSDGGTNADRIVTTEYGPVDTDGDGTPEYGRPSRIRVDTNGDGTPDTDTISIYTADSATGSIVGRVDIVAYHMSDDSIFDRAERHVYGTDDAGELRLDRVEYDMDYSVAEGSFGDGTSAAAGFTANEVTEHVYGADGMLASSGFDIDYDGTTFEADRTYSFRYNARGNREEILIDDDGDGNTDRAERRVYGNNLGLLRRVEHYYDGTIDGNPDARVLSSYDNSDRVNRIRYDDDNDGAFERTVWLTYNSRSQIAATQHDLDGDGTADAREENRYDSSGRVSRVLYDDDNSDDGVYERIMRITYSNGQIASIERDIDARGLIEFPSYDSLGRVDEILYRKGNGDLVRTDTLEYDGNSPRLAERTIQWDEDSDGTIETEETRTYDSRGRLERIESDYRPDYGVHIVPPFNADGGFEYETRPEYGVHIVSSFVTGGSFEYGTREVDEDAGINRTTVYGYKDHTTDTNDVWFDFDGDGAQDMYDFNADGTPNELDFDHDGTVIGSDYNNDGTIETLATYAYGSDGRLQTFTNFVALDYDGTFNVSETHTYPTDRTVQVEFDGAILAPERSLEREPYDGTVDRRDVITYAAASTLAPLLPGEESEALERNAGMSRGRIEKIETYYDDDSVIDRIEAFHYDQDGNWIYTEVDFDNDGNIDRIAPTNPGGPIWDQRDFDDDGTFDVAFRDVFFDDDGRLAFREYSDGGTGPEFEVGTSERWLYDDSGSLWAHVRDNDEDPEYDVLYLAGDASAGTLSYTIAEVGIPLQFPHLESIDLGFLHDGADDPAVDLRFDVRLLRHLAGGADGTIDSRYSASDPYTLKIEYGQGHSSTNDTLSLWTGQFTRASSMDADGFEAYTAGSSSLVLLVDADITVETLSRLGG